MKRINLMFICVIFTVLLIGCGKKKSQNEFYVYKEDMFEYEFGEEIACFDVSKDGMLYCASHNSLETEIVDLSEYHSVSVLSVYDEMGEVKETYEIPGQANWIQIDEEKQWIYYIDVDDYFHKMLCRYNMTNQDAEKLWEIPENQVIEEIFLIQDDIYVYGTDTSGNENQSSKESYCNKYVGKVNLSTGQVDRLPIKEPRCVSKTFNNNLVIYVYENPTTYYFIEYDTVNRSFGEKIYHWLQGAIEFYICNEKNGYFYFKEKQDQTYLTYCEFEQDAAEVELMPYERRSGELLAKYGNIFQLNTKKNRIKRVKNSVYMNDNKEIVLLSPMYYDGRNPFGCGYRTRNQYKEEEELALSVLARNTDYDLFLVSSNLQIADNIRKKGSFYPLNEVDGVKEYLEACFPYIKDAAMNKDGDIWMIPVYIDIPVLMYKEEMCSAYGCSSVKDLSFQEFCSWMKQLQENTSTKELYQMDRRKLTRKLINQYCNQYTTFDTPIFRDLVLDMKERCNYIYDKNEDYLVHSQVLNHQLEEFLFIYYDTSLRIYSNEMEGYSLAPLPRLSSEDASLANCQFIAVNPDSKNLKDVLGYVSSLCKFMLSQNSFYMMKQEDTSTMNHWEREMYEIYSDGEIAFALSDEIVIELYESYLRDEISLDEMIQEADRRLGIYLKE